MTPRDRQRLQTREDIVDVTGAVLRTAGYAGVRIEDVCARAGVSRGAFYHHFPTKEAAIVALLERDSMVLVEYGALIRDRAAGDPALHAALSLALALRFALRELVRFTLMGLGVGRDRAIELGDQAVEFRLPA